MTERTQAVRRTPVRTFRVDLPCSECGVGNMELDRSAHVRTSYPLQHRHECSNCGHKAWISGATYPRYEHEEVVDLAD